MATRVTRTVIDDLDGTDALGTYRFALEGAAYEIDLSAANLQRLRDALAPFTAAGRRLPKNQSIVSARPAGSSATVNRIRRWWADNQHRDDVPAYRANGRLPQQVLDAYQRDGLPQQP